MAEPSTSNKNKYLDENGLKTLVGQIKGYAVKKPNAAQNTTITADQALGKDAAVNIQTVSQNANGDVTINTQSVSLDYAGVKSSIDTDLAKEGSVIRSAVTAEINNAIDGLGNDLNSKLTDITGALVYKSTFNSVDALSAAIGNTEPLKGYVWVYSNGAAKLEIAEGTTITAGSVTITIPKGTYESGDYFIYTGNGTFDVVSGEHQPEYNAVAEQTPSATNNDNKIIIKIPSVQQDTYGQVTSTLTDVEIQPDVCLDTIADATITGLFA